MLILMLQKNDPIHIGDVTISIHPSWKARRIRICFDAPPEVKIVRQKAIDKRRGAEGK